MEVCVPVDSCELFLQFLVRKFVVVGFWVTKFGHALAGFGKTGLDAHNILTYAVGILLAEALMLAEADDVLLEGLANLLCLRVLVDVVVLLSQCQSTLTDVYDIVLGIFLVGSDVHREQTLNALTLHAGPNFLEPVLSDVGRVLITVAQQEFLEGTPIVLVEVHAVHCGVVEGGNLLCHRPPISLQGEFSNAVDDFAQLLVVVLVEHIERTETTVFRSQRMCHLPTVGGVFVEIGSGQESGVQICKVDTGGQCLLTPLTTCKRGCAQCYYSHNFFHTLIILYTICLQKYD